MQISSCFAPAVPRAVWWVCGLGCMGMAVGASHTMPSAAIHQAPPAFAGELVSTSDPIEKSNNATVTSLPGAAQAAPPLPHPLGGGTAGVADCDDNGVPDSSQNTIYVDASAVGVNDGSGWADAFTDLQDALAVATAGQAVWVASNAAAGYAPAMSGGSRSASFVLVDGVSVLGGFPSGGCSALFPGRDPLVFETILTGDISSNDVGDPTDPSRSDNAYHVVRADSSISSGTVLDGFTIQGGHADLVNAVDNDGGGFYGDGGSLTIRSCLFTANRATNRGGGCYHKVGDLTLEACTFRLNQAVWRGGGVFNDGGTLRLNDGRLLANEITSASLGSNGGAGMFAFNGAITLLERCLFAGNVSALNSGGMGLSFVGCTTLTNCVFSSNHAGGFAGALRNMDSSPTLVNCTFHGNTSDGNLAPGGIHNAGTNGSNPTLHNCILWNNGGSTESDQISGNLVSVPSISYSCLQGLTPGGGFDDGTNIGSDPFFLDPDGADDLAGNDDDDLRLTPRSASTDAGNNTVLTPDCQSGTTGLPSTDFDALPRRVDNPAGVDSGLGISPFVDMGAYEYQADCNGNDVHDATDIANATSNDCNNGSAGNGIPDECEIDQNSVAIGGPFFCQVQCDSDCNENGVPDECDVATCNSLDCNGNGVPDACDISTGASHDCNGNGMLDLCEIMEPGGLCLATCAPNDCQCNDQCDPDCNENGIPDACDIAIGTSDDCNDQGTGNGIPDECEIAVDSTAPGGPFYCTTNCDPDCNDNGILDQCDLFLGTSDDCNDQGTGNGIPDECEIAADSTAPGGPFFCTIDCDPDCNNNGILDQCDLFLGTSEDCSDQGTGVGVPDECEIDVNSTAPGGPFFCVTDCDPDCNQNGLLDRCDIASCQSNDCNGNGVPDACDIALGTSDDCGDQGTSNGIPDECEIDENSMAPGGPFFCRPLCDAGDCLCHDQCAVDCNENGVSDGCDIASGASNDCNGNGTPDECEIDPIGPAPGGPYFCTIDCDSDCNENGIPDACDIAQATSQDCNVNGLPDECEIDASSLAPGAPFFCTVDCDPDCNENGIPDICDIDACTSQDCNNNAILDECELGLSPEEDCNSNGILDVCEIPSGSPAPGGPFFCQTSCDPDDCRCHDQCADDCNDDGIPDTCGTRIYVDAAATGLGDGTTWANAYTDLQAGLAHASIPTNAVGELWVAAIDEGGGIFGAYRPDGGGGNRDLSFALPDCVAIYGGFPSAGGDGTFGARNLSVYTTLLSGDLNQDDVGDLGDNSRSDNAYHVVTAGSGVGARALLDGFVITGGNANGSIGMRDRGAGLFNNGGSGAVANCTITGNVAGSGGGMMNQDFAATPTLTHCTFSNNRSRFGGGMYNFNGAAPTLMGCLFQDNEANLDGEGGGIRNETSSNPILVNCIFEGNKAHRGGAIHNRDSSPVLTNCTVSGNEARISASVGHGITNSGSSNVILTNCVLWGNGVDGTLGGQIITGAGSSHTFAHSCVQGFPILTDASGNIGTNPNFINGVFLSPTSPCIDAGDSGIDTMPGTPSQELLPETDARGSARFVDALCVMDTGLGDPSIVVDMGALEFQSDCNGNGVPDACDIDCNLPGGVCNAFAGVCGTMMDLNDNCVPDVCESLLYVDQDAVGADNGSSWADAFVDLQDALDVAAPGGQVLRILVAEGIYFPDKGRTQTLMDRNATFQLISGVEMRGGYAGFGEPNPDQRDTEMFPTILSGNLDNLAILSDNSHHVLTSVGLSATAILDGFTITSGNSAGGTSLMGGGLLNIGGMLTVSHCVFIDNHADDGGAIANTDVAHAVISDCTFTGNGASFRGGAIYNLDSDPNLTRCVFSGNAADFGASARGGAIYNEGMDDGQTPVRGSRPVLVDCAFSNNVANLRGGAVFNDTNADATFLRCVFLRNEALSAGAMLNSNCRPSVDQCVFVGNMATSVIGQGGAMLNVAGATPFVVHCSFSANCAGDFGGGLFNQVGTGLVLSNSILWNNCVGGQTTDESAQLFVEAPVNLDVRYNCIQGLTGGLGGDGNIGADPMFKNDPGAGGCCDAAVLDFADLRLQAGSPCADAGDNRLVPGAASEDLDNNVRLCDDPAALDSGFGLSPLVDMGAYETQSIACLPPVLPTYLAAEGPRYIGVRPPPGQSLIAILLTGDAGNPEVSCISHYVQDDGRLGTSPVWLTPSSWNTVHIGDDLTIPESLYTVQIDSGVPGVPVLSSPLTATTWLWGDVDNSGGIGLSDLLCLLDALGGDFSICGLYAADLVETDRNVGLADLLTMLDILGGADFSEAMPCP